VAVHLGAVDTALIVTALEVLVLVKDDLEEEEMGVWLESVFRNLKVVLMVLCNFVPVLPFVPSVQTQGLHKPDHICFPLPAIIIEFIIDHNYKYYSDFGVSNGRILGVCLLPTHISAILQ
jgi:hypothetical protein